METFYSVDPLSDRYRICPNCKIAHMVHNRGRDFCTDKCADDYYNTHRRLTRQATNVPPLANTSLITRDQMLAKNLNVLNHLSIDETFGTKYLITDIVNSGFDFSFHTSRNVLHNTDFDNQCFYISIFEYKILLLTTAEILIAKNK